MSLIKCPECKREISDRADSGSNEGRLKKIIKYYKN